MALVIAPVDILRVEASEYVAAVGLVILVWDHILTFADEVHLVWSSRLSVPKVLFLFNRYLVPVVMIVQSHEFSGAATYLSLTVSHVVCKVWYAIMVTVGMLSISTSNFLILLRLWVLWDRPPRLMLGTLAFFVVAQATALALAGYVIHKMLPTLIINPLLRICMPATRPDFVLLWTPGVAFELMIFLTTVWNALDKPRPHEAQMAKIMYRDGSMYFIGLFALRIINMVLSIAAPFSLSFLGVFFIWSVSNITLARLILNLRRLSNNPDDDEEEEGLTGDTRKGMEAMEMSVFRSEYSQRCDLVSPLGSPNEVY